MRYAVLFILLSSLAAADSFTLYSGDTATFDGQPFSVVLYHTENPEMLAAARVYSLAKDANATGTATQNALYDLQDALEIAKATDRVFVMHSSSSSVIPYGGCNNFGEYRVCFTGITYYEEDIKPLGDGRFNTVKLVGGEIMLPITLTIATGESTLTGKRFLSETSVYPYDEVTVRMQAINTGTAATSRFRAEDYSEVPFRSGERVLEQASLAAGTTKETSYVLRPTTPGIYNISAKTDGITIPNSTLTVKEALIVNATRFGGFLEEPVTAQFALKNTYDEDISFSSLSIEASTDVARCSHPATPKGTQERSFDIDLAKGASMNISCTIEPITTGTHSMILTLRSSESAIGTRTHKVKLPVIERNLRVTPSVLASTLTLNFNNTLQQRIDGISIDYGDGSSESLVMFPESSLEVRHVYVATHPTVVTVTALGEPQQFPLSFSSQSELPPEQPPIEQPITGTPNAQSNQPETQNTTPPAGSGALTPEKGAPFEDERSIVTKFLDWLNGLFS